MDYVSHRFRARSAIAGELLTVLQGAGFAAASITRADGDEDVCLYCADDALPSEAAAILQIYRAEALNRQDGELSDWLGPNPRPLAGHWWVASAVTHK